MKRLTAFVLCLLISVCAVPFTSLAAVTGDAVDKGLYCFVNVYTGKYLTLDGNTDTDNAHIHIETRDKNSQIMKHEAVRQVMKIKTASGGNYYIQPAETTTRVVSVSGTPATDRKIRLITTNELSKNKWLFKKVSTSVYSIRCADNTSFALGISDVANKSDVVLKKYDSRNTEQQWKLVPYNIRQSGDFSGISSYGIDVSHWQGEINWQAVKEFGINFAVLNICGNQKRTEDDCFETNYKNARANGIKLGAYIYTYSTTVSGAEKDAAAVLSFIKNRPLDYPIFFDIEDDAQASLSKTRRTNMCVAFMEKIKEAGYDTGVYASESWLKDNVDKSVIAANGKIWIAKWPGSNQPDIDMSADFMWQYRSDGVCAGISGDVDMDVVFTEAEDEFVYNGLPKEPQFAVNINGVDWIKDVDYTVAYENNVNVGTAKAIYTGIGDKTGTTFIQEFEIKPKDVSVLNYGELSDKTYSGAAIVPNPAVMHGNRKLVKGVDYTLTYKNNTEAGTGKITVAGKGNYVGKKTLRFVINKKKIKNCTVTGIENIKYSGKKQTLKLKVKTPKKTLKKNVDYKVSYKNNKNFGTATVTLTGIGNNLTGTIKKTFNIVPGKVKNITATTKYKQVRLSWKHVGYADGYQIYRSDKKNGKYVRVGKNTYGYDHIYIDNAVSKGRYYFYKVRAYKKVDGKKVYGNWSSVFTAKTKLESVGFSLKGNKSDRTVTVNINKLKGASGYTVYLYDNTSGKFKKVSSDKTVQRVIQLDGVKKQRIKVRAYKKSDGGTVYGKMSAEQTVF